MLNLGSLMIGTRQFKTMAAFYEKVLGRAPDMTEPENGITGWKVGSGFLAVLEHSEMGGAARDPGRVIFNFETAQVQQEFDRIKALGAAVVRAPYQIGEEWIATFADPDGNYFQLMSPME
jgi:predicted enzyme related to lactoylglutathione lyase